MFPCWESNRIIFYFFSEVTSRKLRVYKLMGGTFQLCFLDSLTPQFLSSCVSPSLPARVQKVRNRHEERAAATPNTTRQPHIAASFLVKPIGRDVWCNGVRNCCVKLYLVRVWSAWSIKISFIDTVAMKRSTMKLRCNFLTAERSSIVSVFHV